MRKKCEDKEMLGAVSGGRNEEMISGRGQKIKDVLTVATPKPMNVSSS